MLAFGRVVFFFFFSSRRRHTRCSRDWSSDVCSSDLGTGTPAPSVNLPDFAGLAEHVAPSVVNISSTQEVKGGRSEEHTSELQSRLHLVCRLLLEKKKRDRRQ